jgi:hypothetical protein
MYGPPSPDPPLLARVSLRRSVARFPLLSFYIIIPLLFRAYPHRLLLLLFHNNKEDREERDCFTRVLICCAHAPKLTCWGPCKGTAAAPTIMLPSAGKTSLRPITLSTQGLLISLLVSYCIIQSNLSNEFILLSQVLALPYLTSTN